MFTLWPEPIELPKDRTNTSMYKTEIFDSPENARIAFNQACKENKFPFIYMRPMNQAEFEEQQRQKQANLNSNFPKRDSILETDNTPLTNDEVTNILNESKEVSIPSFTIKTTTEIPNVTCGDDSIKNPNAMNKGVYTPTGYFAPEEQKKYTEAISKVYNPTGATLEGFTNNIPKDLLDTVAKLKNYIKDKDTLSKVQTDIITAALSSNNNNSNNEYSIYSITKEQDEKASKWWSDHYRRYHSGKRKFLCAGMESENVIEWHFTNIGPYCVSVCKDCEKLYKDKKAEVAKLERAAYGTEPTKMSKEDLKKDLKKKKKELAKLEKRYEYTIREIDE